MRELQMRSRSLLQPALCALPLLGLLLFARNLYTYASIAPVSFDGAMNLNTAVSLAAGNGYGFFYDSFFPFAASTDGPYILPAALLIHFFGVSPLVTQAVNLLYVGAFAWLLTALLRRLGLPLWVSLVGVLAVVSVPGFTEFGMNGYGEIPAMAWYLAGLLAFARTFDAPQTRLSGFLAGVFLAVSYLTKVVSLVFVAPLFAVAFLFALRGQLKRDAMVLLCCGFALPIVLWEAYRLVSLGGLANYALWWKLQLGQILYQSGVKYTTAEFGRKAIRHFSILSSITGLGGYLLAAFIALPSVLFVLARDRFAAAEKPLVLSLLLSGLVYFAWWLLLTPTSMAWLRRILDGIIIHQLLLFALASRIIIASRNAAGPARSRAWIAAALSVVALVPVVALSRTGQSVTRPIEPPDYAASLLDFASRVRDLPADAVIFGTAWWQSPRLALYSGRRFHNFQHHTPEEINRMGSKYFAFEPSTVGSGLESMTEALALTDSDPIFKSDGGELYRIRRARDHAPLEISAADWPKLRPRMDFSQGDYEFKRGFYQIEDGKFAWMRTDGLVVLAREGEKRLEISLVAPQALYEDGPPEFRAEVPGCANQTFRLSKPGENRLEVTLNCPASPVRTPLYAYLHVNRHMPFVHQLDADNRLLGVLVHSVGLAD